MNTPLRVLMVEDSESDAGLIIRRLQGAGYDLVHERVETAGDMRTALAKPDWDIVLADYRMPHFSASAALEILKESGRDLPFIIVSGTIGEEKAVALMKAGAHDYVMKHNLARLVPAVARELKEAEGRRERRRAEEALLQSEATLSSILRAAPIGIGLVTQRVFGWTNEHLSRMTGYSCGELQGQSARMLYDREAEFERVGQVKYAGIKQQGTGSLETRWRRKDGKLIDVFLSSTPIDPLDLEAGVVFTAMDITHRQEAEVALRESEERYRTLVENIDLGITLISSDYRVIMTNAAMARLLQKPTGEMVGRECFREFEKRDGVCAHCPGTEAMATGRKAVVETTGVRDDGSRLNVRVQAFPHRGPDGRITGFIEVVEDISERKRMEAALHESENLYRSLFENMLNGFAYFKMLFEDGQPQDFIWLKVNKSFEAMTGLKDVVGKRVSEVIPGMRESDPELFESFGRVASTGKPERFEIYVKSLKMWFSISLYSPGKGYFVTVFDVITERKRAESELKLKERLLDSASDSIFLYDLEGNFLYVNEAAYITRWYGKEELLSLGAWALKTPEAAVYQDNVLRELWANGELIFESEHRRKDGSVIPVEIFARILAVEGRELILSVARDITERKQAETQVRQGLDNLHQALHGTVMALANTVEIKDPYTAGHQRRVAQLSCAMARELGWSPDRIEGIQVLCFLHDMGKIAVPAEILNKPGKISLTEFSLIKVHPQVGYDILKDIAFPWPVAQGVLQHHERQDGSGYPSGLTAGEITPEAKILAVADVVEALASHRPYRPALGIDQALEEITQNRGKRYDPDAVDVCVRLLTEKNFRFD
ncbi:MAG: PAS domain S-box protein [Deltaproteobacteria bacterium]|nr:PAS domain S-box protein [Deltaproteobacteria bacterium]